MNDRNIARYERLSCPICGLPRSAPLIFVPGIGIAHTECVVKAVSEFCDMAQNTDYLADEDLLLADDAYLAETRSS